MHVLKQLDYDQRKKAMPKTTFKDRQIKHDTKTHGTKVTKQLFGNAADVIVQKEEAKEEEKVVEEDRISSLSSVQPRNP